MLRKSVNSGRDRRGCRPIRLVGTCSRLLTKQVFVVDRPWMTRRHLSDGETVCLYLFALRSGLRCRSRNRH